MSAFSQDHVSRALGALAVIPMPEASSEDARLQVHAAVSKASSFYEKIRNAIDYKDEHLVRKAAIERIVKRRALFEHEARAVALHLIRELIAAKYLPNQALPESLVDEVRPIIEKFFAVRGSLPLSLRQEEWILGLVAAELEECLGDRGQAQAMANFLFDKIDERIRVTGSFDNTTRRLQVYIACHRVLFKADDDMLAYRLIRFYVSAWMRPLEWLGAPTQVAREILTVQAQIMAQLHHQGAQKFLQAVKPWGVALDVLRELLQEKPVLMDKLTAMTPELKSNIVRLAERRYEHSRNRLKRGTRRSIIYLLLSKMLLAFAIELPFERLIYQQIHTLALAVNVFFPPTLMWLLGRFIRLPDKENTERIVLAVEELLSTEGPKGREIKQAKQRTPLGRVAFGGAYFFTFVLTFGLIVYGLRWLNFTWVSSVIFLFFLCVVSFFAYRLRWNAREYIVTRDKESLRTVLVDIFMLPILRAGQYMSAQVSRINIFVFVFDFIVEAPFKTLLNMLEELFAYLKEKKEELQ